MAERVQEVLLDQEQENAETVEVGVDRKTLEPEEREEQVVIPVAEAAEEEQEQQLEVLEEQEEEEK